MKSKYLILAVYLKHFCSQFTIFVKMGVLVLHFFSQSVRLCRITQPATTVLQGDIQVKFEAGLSWSTSCFLYIIVLAGYEFDKQKERTKHCVIDPTNLPPLLDNDCKLDLVKHVMNSPLLSWQITTFVIQSETKENSNLDRVLPGSLVK